MDECLDVLADADEYPTDDILIQLVRMQLVADKAVQVSTHDEEVGANGPIRTPPALYRVALQAQLQEVEKSLPRDFRHEVIPLHFHIAALAVNELGSLKSSPASSHLDIQDVESNYASLRSLKSWFDLFFAIPPSRYTGFPFSIYSQILRCIMALYRLSTLDDPAWDKRVARNTADIPLIIQQLAANLRASDVYPRYAEAFDVKRAVWENKVAAMTANPAEPVVRDTDMDLPNLNMDIPSDWWGSEIFTAWEF